MDQTEARYKLLELSSSIRKDGDGGAEILERAKMWIDFVIPPIKEHASKNKRGADDHLAQGNK